MALQWAGKVGAKTSPNLLPTGKNLVVTSALLADRAALQTAIAIAQKSERACELADLIRERGWDQAARICAHDCQSRALRLPHWSDEVPCQASVRGRSRASRLLRRMLRRGVSRYDPNPLAALEAAARSTQV
jgi:hypothetical protein